jgi:alkylation response protein AidB-like acyl-CoA dehydrogenase
MTRLISPQLQQLGDDVRAWSVAELRPYARQADQDHLAPPQVTKAFDIAPFRGSPAAGMIEADSIRGIPEGRYMTATVVNEAGTYGDILFVTSAPGGGIGGKVVELIGTPEQIERWTGGLNRGEYSFSGFALTEPGCGSDAASLRATALRDGDRWIINGTKMFCSGGAVSDYVIVFASIDRTLGHRGIRAFVVEKDTKGFTVAKPNEDKLGCRAMLTSELVFEDVAVPLDHCLGEPERQPNSFATAMSALNTTRHQVASMACGLAQAVVDEASVLLREMSSGFTPARWSRVESDLAAMNAAIDHARLLARRAAWLIDNGEPFHHEAAMAKAYAPPIAEKVCLRAVQLLGPDGWSEELPFEKWYRDVKIIDIWEGTGQMQRRAVSRSLFATPSARI